MEASIDASEFEYTLTPEAVGTRQNGVLSRIPAARAIGSSLSTWELSVELVVFVLFEVDVLSVISVFEQDTRSKEQMEITDEIKVYFFIICTNLQAVHL